MTDMSDMAEFNRQIIEEFRANNGQVGGPFEGSPMLLLHHIGARSGTERITPLLYLPDEERYIVFASKAGGPSNPDWYYNLRANPQSTIELGGGTIPVVAEEVTGPERDELFARQAAAVPGFGDYERQTAGIRTIPVIGLRPAV